ncbi:uncharacterized protein NECHADRAFT_102079 [Fusarium vanettenii 77-13-4]|uniref:Uncharacterized protein n=1 Tax=Fusarium vanettenii (strain ATCC MYA-4622 / CBS 123669 / FGSC 9596 / NRRL 45880 / 77-13-4) TaxID=660122 RepID=C7ZIM5_FUSV7|nr:uncharacterized protein NECHADRAFT_102079 [Fusarium vanettenii 77-13-4]EEU36051.1 predicted protein [Fusarium vanettenii 77-13-4]
MAQPSFLLEHHFDGMETKLMRELAQHDIEYKSSAAWQAYLNRMFPRPWQLLCEQAPDDESRRRVDFKIILYDQDNDTISPVAIGEVKRPGGSIREVEKQGLEVAMRAINSHCLSGIYVLTVWGLKFRAWYATSSEQSLMPLFGSAPRDKNEYIDMTSPSGVFELERTIHLIKDEPPLRQAPVVPSQQDEMGQMIEAGTFYSEEGGSQVNPMYPWGQQPSVDYQTTQIPRMEPSAGHPRDAASWMPSQEPYPQEDMSIDDPEEANEGSGAEGNSGGKGKEKRSTKERREVKVELVKHRMSKDEYVFRGADGSKRTTQRSDWKQKKRDVKPNGKRSGQFQYRSRADPRSQARGGLTTYKSCAGHCVHNDGKDVGCHFSCLRIPEAAQIYHLLMANTYSFEPDPLQERTRCLRAQKELASELQNTLPFPMELRARIAQELVREYIVAKNSSLLGCSTFKPSTITIASEITETYTAFEGEQYISSLANDPSSCDTYVPPKVIYIGEDHLGIRKLVFSRSRTNPDVDYVPGIWWKPLLVRESGTVEFASDVRGLNIGVKSSPNQSVWVYMPLEPNERVTRVWMRARHCLDRDAALAFETNRGHTKLFGAQPTPVLSACQWVLLDTPLGSPGHFFFDNHPYGTRQISLDTLPPKQTSGFAPPAASSDYPKLHSTDDFLWSRASVENVVAVRPCRRQTGDLMEILGLLLYYSDGKQAPIGQVRFDYLDQPILTDGCPLIYLGFEKTKPKGPFVSRLETAAHNLDNKVSMWFEVFLKGALEWWLSYRQCQVCQDGRRSMPVRI